MQKETYIEKRNKLIPIAEQYANEIMGDVPPDNSRRISKEWGDKWNILYHGKMDELAQGLRKRYL